MQEKKEKEALAAEGGWTVVGHQRGRKKTTDPESGIAVGSAVPVAKADDILAKKKRKEVGVDFYRFQKREAHMNGMDESLLFSQRNLVTYMVHFAPPCNDQS